MNAADALRDALPAPGTPRFWRALEELLDDASKRPLLEDAWPGLASIEPTLDRRGFLRLLGASIAFAGLGACSGPPPERIVPELGRGGDTARHRARYATAIDTGNDVVGLLVALRDGRPMHVDGNPKHPATLGGSDPRMQAAILDLWDPARSSAPLRQGQPASWTDFETEAADLRHRFAASGDGLHVLSGAIRSPTLARQRDALLRRYPGAHWHVHEPAGAAHATWDLADTRIIVAFDADPLGTAPGHVRHARDVAAARADTELTTRLYAIEPTPSLTGRNADHVWPVAAGDIPVLIGMLARACGLPSPSMAGMAGDRHVADRIGLIAKDLLDHRGHALVLAGPYLPPSAHATVDAINRRLGRDTAPTRASSGDTADLLAQLEARRVDTLLVLESNPAYSLPGFAFHARNTIHLGRYVDETAAQSQWHLPALHPFEHWSDLRQADDVASIVQPVIAPLVDGRSAHELVDLLLGGVTDDPLRRVRDTWPMLADDDAWTEALRDGIFHGDTSADASASPADDETPAPADETLELVFRPDPHLWDGRHAGNAWLQELPHPITTQAWGNAAWISPTLASARGLRDGDRVRLDLDGRHVDAPVLVVPGQAERSVTVTLGHGRRTGLGAGHGYDAYALRARDGQWHARGLTLTPLSERTELALTQGHQDMQRRDIIRVGTPDRPLQPSRGAPASFYPDTPSGDYRWSMSIDLDACIGCNACTIACQSENNIPVVGEGQVKLGRRMHWIRVDRYHEGSPTAPATYHQPVPCMHCEHAPCEVVCPVEATVHDGEGLNLQVYNSCIGTRFCSNNCPYKVRRFNFLAYADFARDSLEAMRNPEVSVRAKGVMEKCTYCVQRIQQAHASADREGRRIADGEVTTACQDACPTRAIVFGDLSAPASAVAKAHASPRKYALLEELNTRPRTVYLAAWRHPHPDWSEA
ncbi:Fe-S-cluster-containing hydrogenase [Luteibacter aegosomatis]|uniref:Fe-S-cluster-containing hydrogenase n=1 Tax=Luteibacter aegosomatis TaxID=2911537 RepID=UPI001FFA53D4|nr:Fe-S-cluster-containing hydrogenase [Luteibacter aegosomatis]UPG87683.1 Fe-S-cluster-containing hydrogenase [Luteibacter aegosomatis]